MPNDVPKTEPSAFINSSTPSSSASNIFNRNQPQPPSNLATMTIQEKLQQERFQEQNSSASNGKVVVNEFIPGRSEWKAPARKDDSTATIGQMRQETATFGNIGARSSNPWSSSSAASVNNGTSGWGDARSPVNGFGGSSGVASGWGN